MRSIPIELVEVTNFKDIPVPQIFSRRFKPALLLSALVGLVALLRHRLRWQRGRRRRRGDHHHPLPVSPGSVDPLELADALGYLDGIELDKVGDVQGGPESLQALATNQIDIAAAAFFGAIGAS